jgi:single-strand DNA-binding protein
MSSFAKAHLMGNLTSDVEVKYVGGGNTAVANISIAVNEKRKTAAGYADVVHFIDVTLWGKTAENAAQYIGKGRQVVVIGDLQQERWDDNNGNKRSRLKVNCRELHYTSGGKRDNQNSNQGSSQNSNQGNSNYSTNQGDYSDPDYSGAENPPNNSDIPF